MNITDSIALVTGANRGLGRAFVHELLARGASKVYATVRHGVEVDDIPGVEVLRLDIRDPQQIAAAAERAGDVTLLVNNAGISAAQDLVGGELDEIRRELDTLLFGTLGMVRGFAPILGANGGGAIVNVLSAMSWFTAPGASSYHVAKAAQWALTNGIRLELAGQGTLVTGVHLGLADTDMAAGFDAEKLAPSTVAQAALDGVQLGSLEVLVDDWSRGIKASLARDPSEFYTGVAGS